MSKKLSSSLSDDISNRTVVIVLVVLLVVSVISSWMYISELSKVRPTSAADKGTVSLTIVGPSKPATPVETTGNVALNIEKAK